MPSAAALRTTLALALILGGFLLDLVLILLILGDAVAPARLPPGFAAGLALAGGAMLVAGLALVEPRRVPAELGAHARSG